MIFVACPKPPVDKHNWRRRLGNGAKSPRPLRQASPPFFRGDGMTIDWLRLLTLLACAIFAATAWYGLYCLSAWVVSFEWTAV